MIARGGKWFRLLRRWISRNEWTIRWLRLPKSHGAETQPGLVLVQIDGLSRRQLERAVAGGRMPFLNRLRTREGYRLHTFYSGLPSSTPGVQGELFYGVRCAVPAFHYRDHESGELGRMFDPEAAAHVQARLEKQGPGLLAGGSAYADIYSGGAAESRFCPATQGWGELARTINPITLAGVVLWHGASAVRTAVLMLVEFVLAVVNFFRGGFRLSDLGKELKFVPSRVVVCILLRELVTIGAMADVTRGLPIVHINLLGYDEQAHRRGPSSAFAHWSLKGIDGCIKRIWDAAQRSHRRHYDVWVYADHGQERTVPYSVENGRTVQEAVAAVFGSQPAGQANPKSPPRRRAPSERARWLGAGAGAVAHGRQPDRNRRSRRARRRHRDGTAGPRLPGRAARQRPTRPHCRGAGARGRHSPGARGRGPGPREGLDLGGLV